MENTDQEAIIFGDLWSIQESLLQTYRTVFITLESVLIAVETFLLSSNQSLLLIGLPIMLLGLSLIPVWMGVCNARANAVAFIHWLIQRYESGEEIKKPYTHFRQFQENRTYKGINVLEDKRYRYLGKSKTRYKMDVVVPVLFAATWILLLLITLMIKIV